MAALYDAGLPALGADLAGLSVDAPPVSAALRQQLGLPFPLLCDTGRKVVAEWGLYNRQEKGGIAYPAVFVIDTDRRVRYRSLERTAARVCPEALAAFLRGGMQGPAESAPVRVVPRLCDFGRVMVNALCRGIRSPRTE